MRVTMHKLFNLFVLCFVIGMVSPFSADAQGEKEREALQELHQDFLDLAKPETEVNKMKKTIILWKIAKPETQALLKCNPKKVKGEDSEACNIVRNLMQAVDDEDYEDGIRLRLAAIQAYFVSIRPLLKNLKAEDEIDMWAMATDPHDDPEIRREIFFRMGEVLRRGSDTAYDSTIDHLRRVRKQHPRQILPAFRKDFPNLGDRVVDTVESSETPPTVRRAALKYFAFGGMDSLDVENHRRALDAAEAIIIDEDADAEVVNSAIALTLAYAYRDRDVYREGTNHEKELKHLTGLMQVLVVVDAMLAELERDAPGPVIPERARFATVGFHGNYYEPELEDRFVLKRLHDASRKKGSETHEEATLARDAMEYLFISEKLVIFIKALGLLPTLGSDQGSVDTANPVRTDLVKAMIDCFDNRGLEAANDDLHEEEARLIGPNWAARVDNGGTDYVAAFRRALENNVEKFTFKERESLAESIRGATLDEDFLRVADVLVKHLETQSRDSEWVTDRLTETLNDLESHIDHLPRPGTSDEEWAAYADELAMLIAEASELRAMPGFKEIVMALKGRYATLIPEARKHYLTILRRLPRK